MKLLSMPNSVLRVPKRLSSSTLISMAAVLLVLATVAPLPAHAASLSAINADIELKKEDGKSRAAAKAQATHGGKVLSVNTQQKNGQTVYKVKLLLDSGRIKIVTVSD